MAHKAAQAPIGIVGVAGTVDAVVGRIDAERGGGPRSLGQRLGGPVAKTLISECQPPVGTGGAGSRQLCQTNLQGLVLNLPVDARTLFDRT